MHKLHKTTQESLGDAKILTDLPANDIDRTNTKDPDLIRNTLTYLRALYPHGTSEQLTNIVLNTEDPSSAARYAHDVFNPDVHSFSYLKGQWDAKQKGISSAFDGVNAFHGMNDNLRNSIEDLFRSHHFNGLSLMQEYANTVCVFPIDTSNWDAEMLLQERALPEMAHHMLALTHTELATEDSCFPVDESSSQGHMLNSHAIDNRKNKNDEQKNNSSSGTSPNAPSFTPPSEQEGCFSHATDSFLQASCVENTARPLPAPIIRWAPKVLRIGSPEDCQGTAQISSALDANLFVDNCSPLIVCVETAQQKKRDKPADTSQIVKEREDFKIPGAAFISSKLARSCEPFDNGREASYFLGSPCTPRRSAPPASFQFNDTKETSCAAALETLQLRPTPTEAMTPNTSVTCGSNTMSSAELINTEPPESTHAEGIERMSANPYDFIIAEKKRWSCILKHLRPYSETFKEGNCGGPISQIVRHCPSFLKHMNSIFQAALKVLCSELRDRTLCEPIEEKPICIPFIGAKIVSTGDFRFSELEFDFAKCKIQLTPCGTRVKIKLVIKRLSFHPIHFAYISESTAAKQDMQIRRSLRGNSDYPPQHCNKPAYRKGATNGVLNVKASNICVSLLGNANFISSRGIGINIENSSVSIKSLKLSTDVTKLFILCTLGRPIIKYIVEKFLENAMRNI